MADAAVGDIFLVTAFGVYEQQRIMLTHHYRLAAIDPGITVGLAMATLGAGIRAGAGGLDLWESDYLNLLPPEYELEFFRVQIIAPQRFVPVDLPRGVPGNHAGSTEAPNQAAVITLRTEKSGRNQVSNKHIGPIPQDVSVQDNGLVTPAYKSLMDLLGTSLLDSFSDIVTGGTWNPVIFHNTTPVITSDALQSRVSQATLRVMRRRTVGLGI